MQTVSLGVVCTFIEVCRVVYGHGWVQSCQAAGQGEPNTSLLRVLD